MRGIPSEVRITSKITYDVVWQKKILVGSSSRQRESAIGYCCTESKLIILKMGMPITQARKTFLHELLHALAHEYDLALPHATLYALEAPLEAFLKVNGWWK